MDGCQETVGFSLETKGKAIEIIFMEWNSWSVKRKFDLARL